MEHRDDFDSFVEETLKEKHVEDETVTQPKEILPLIIRRVMYLGAVALGVAGIIVGVTHGAALGAALAISSAYVASAAGVALAHPTLRGGNNG